MYVAYKLSGIKCELSTWLLPILYNFELFVQKYFIFLIINEKQSELLFLIYNII